MTQQGFDAFNLSPAEERARRLVRQAQDALAPAAMRGELGERSAFDEFVLEQNRIIGEQQAEPQKTRILEPDRFVRFLEGKSAEFEEITGQPSPFTLALQEDDQRAQVDVGGFARQVADIPVSAAQGFFGGALEGFLDSFKPVVPESVAEPLPNQFGIQRVGEALTQLTSPFDVALTAFTAGLGPALLSSRATAGPVARTLLAPLVRGNLPTRVAAETAAGVGAVIGGQELAERAPENPAAQVAATVGGGLLGAVAGVGAFRGAQRGAQAVPGAIEAVAERTRPRATAFAATEEITDPRLVARQIAADVDVPNLSDQVAGVGAGPEYRMVAQSELTRRLNAGTINPGPQLIETPEGPRPTQWFNEFFDEIEQVRAGQTAPTLTAPRQLAAATDEGAEAVARGVGEEAITEAIPPNQAARRTLIDETNTVGRETPDAVPPEVAEAATREIAAPDGGLPPQQPPTSRAGGPLNVDPSDSLRRARLAKLPEERLDERLLIQHEAAINRGQRQARIVVNQGNDRLITAGLGTRRLGTVVPRNQADVDRFDSLLEALNEPSRVRSGELTVEPSLQGAFDDLRLRHDFEEAARIDFDPNMATIADHFYRGWRPPPEVVNATRDSQGRLVTRPGFTMPRVNASYREMRNAGFEPLFWNPYEQLRVSRLQGVKYRQQTELVEALKSVGEDLIQPHEGGAIKAGWRVPEVGPAFEGKPFPTVNPTTGEPSVGYSRRWIVRNDVANILENMYGKKPSLSTVSFATGPGGRQLNADILKFVDFATFVPKRIGLFGTFFQQIDFLTRAGFGSFGNAVDALARGQPITAVEAIIRYPVTAAEILTANFSPTRRQTIMRAFDSTEPIISGRPGVTLKSVSDEGLSIQDITIFPEDMDVVLREAASDLGIADPRRALRAVQGVERAMRTGLFQGVYPAAVRTDVVNNIGPQMARLYGDQLTDAQLSARIAKAANIRYSTIPAAQSAIQNRFIRETGRRALFSVNELEGLTRQATNTVKGPARKFWIANWLGGYLFLMSVANLVHLTSTGQPLPLERYTPIAKDNFGPLPFGYNARFAAPTLPGVARGGTDAVLDIVGQMDTAFRVLDPQQFTESRFSIPVRAVINQWSGQDFFGRSIDDIGPGGVVSRTSALLLDLFSPFGAGPVLEEAARQNIPGAEGLIPRGESRLGLGGLAIQATGFNLRANSNAELEAALNTPELSPEDRQAIVDELSRRDEERGTTRNRALDEQRRRSLQPTGSR